MKKPGKGFAIAKMCEEHLKERKIKQNDLNLYLKCHSSTGVFSSCFCKSTTWFLRM